MRELHTDYKKTLYVAGEWFTDIEDSESATQPTVVSPPRFSDP